MKNMTLQRTRRFTLIELLVVVAIIMVLLGISAGSWTRIVLGSSVDRAGRMVSTQLSLVRAEAVAKRRSVALVMPGANCFPTANFPRPYNYSAMRAAYVNGGKFEEWVPGTDWIFLPEGAIIAQCDDDSSPELNNTGTPNDNCNAGDFNDSNYYIVADSGCPMDFVDEDGVHHDGKDPNPSGYSGQIRAVVFNKDGSCLAKTYITIMEGIVPKGSTTPINTQQSNLNVLEISKLTGKVHFLFH